MNAGHYLSGLFEPRSVALVGASADERKVSGLLLRNMLDAGYRGRLLAVNPKHQEVAGIPCVASVGQLPLAVDLAVIPTPPAPVPDIISA